MTKIKFSSPKSVNSKNFPIFGNIRNFITHSSPRAFVHKDNDKITFGFRDED